MKKSSILNYALLVLNVIFLIYYIVLAVYMPLHYDDLHFMWSARTQTLPEFLQWVYFDRSGRMAVYAASWLYGYIAQATWCWWFMPLIMMLIGWGLCWLFMRRLPLGTNNITKLNVMVLIYNLYILTCVDFAVFYWMCAMQYYLMMPALLGLIALVTQKKLTWYEWGILGLIVAMIGLGYEVWVPTVLLALFFVGLYFWKKQSWKVQPTWDTPQVKRIVSVAVVIIALMLFAISSPGMWNRIDEGACEGIVRVTSVGGFVVAMTKAITTFIYLMSFYIPYYFVLIFIFIYFGIHGEYKYNISIKQLFWYSTGIYVLLNLVAIAPIAYSYGGFGIQRVYHPLVLLLILYLCAIGYLLGYKLKEKSKIEKSILCLTYAGMFVMGIIMVGNVIMDAPIAKAYKEAQENRFAYLASQQAQGGNGIVLVDPMPIYETKDVKYVVMKMLGQQNPVKSAIYYSNKDQNIIGLEYEEYTKKLLNLSFDFDVKSCDAELPK